MRRVCRVVALVFVAGVAWSLVPSVNARAQTSACDAFSGSARSQCHTYCDARQCQVAPQPSCDQLRKNFAKQTGTAVFPCDVAATATPQRTATRTATLTPVPSSTATPTSTSTPVPSPTATLVATACPDVLEVRSQGGELDAGWTGIWHGLPAGGTDVFTVDVTGCANPTPPCGVCTLSGPIANVADDAAGTQRCAADLDIHCTSDAECVDGPCVIFAGAPAPYAFGGVAACIVNQIVDVDGTIDVESGATTLDLSLLSDLNYVNNVGHPCPRCIGDAVPNDGVEGGTCDAGARIGVACDANGSPAIASFGPTSIDCPPAPDVATTVPMTVRLTTDTATRVLSASTPNCRGFVSAKCFCDTCNSRPFIGCASNADCPDPAGPIGAICGGRQCLGGSNDGAACTTNSQCPGTICVAPGEPTKPNACTDGVCTETADDHGTCAAGPMIGHCDPNEPYRACNSAADCRAGDTCVVENYQCYPDNGVSSISATGTPDPLGTDLTAMPTLVGLTCSPNTFATALNAVVGLPGLVRMTMPVEIRDPTATP